MPYFSHISVLSIASDTGINSTDSLVIALSDPFSGQEVVLVVKSFV